MGLVGLFNSCGELDRGEVGEVFDNVKAHPYYLGKGGGRRGEDGRLGEKGNTTNQGEESEYGDMDREEAYGQG